MTETYNKVSRRPIYNWVESVVNNRKKLLLVPITHSFISSYGISVNKTWLENLTGVHRKVAEREAKILVLLDSVIEAMIDEQIVVEGESASSNNVRRKILEWYYSLSDDKKLEIPMHRNGINLKKVTGFIINNERTSIAVKSVLKQINYEQKLLINKCMTKEEIAEKYYKIKKKKLIDDKRNHFRRFEKTIACWANGVIDKNIGIWEIPIATRIVGGKCKYLVSQNWIINKLNITQYAYRINSDVIHSVIPRMIEKKVIIEGENARCINYRRNLYNWFHSLSDADKKILPIFNNKISYKYLHEKFRVTYISDAIKNTLDDIHKKLEALSVVESSETYITYTQRLDMVNKDFHADKKRKSEDWIRLSEITLDNKKALLEPTDSEPYIQIKQIFARCLGSSASNDNNYKDGYSKFIEYITNLHGKQKFFLSKIINEFTMIEFRAYLEKEVIAGNFSPSYASGIMSTIRGALNKLKSIDGIDFPYILEAEGFVAVRTTDRYRPFSNIERVNISKSIQNDLIDRRLMLVPYKNCINGVNPLDDNDYLKSGMNNDDNAKWLFENRLNKEIITYAEDANDKSTLEMTFLRMIRNLGGVHETYARWNIASKIDINFLLPYVLRLAQITGLNQISICDIELDGYVENHPATGRPCLRYWKERSDGEKEYHLDIFKADLGWLTTKQSLEIKILFNDVKELTKSIREEASGDIKNHLFIYKQQGCEVSTLTIGKLFNPVKNYSEINNFVDGEGEPTQFNISRFRPTFVSELIELGVSIREIQLLLGHSNIETTMNYLDKLDFNKKARELLSSKLNEIHANVFTSNNFKNVDEHRDEIVSEVIFNTPLASCKNIFNPPGFIKSLPTYVKGTPCANYNKCLSCDNVIITSSHLPELFAMERDYLAIIKRNRIGDTPYGKVVQENILLLNEVLNYEFSDFSIDELEKGKRLSMYIETSILVDGVVA